MEKISVWIALENIRSLYNVGSIFRSCSFFGIDQVALVGYSGKRPLANGTWEMHEKINKTALGSEKDLVIKEFETTEDFVKWVRESKLRLIAAEQDKKSIELSKWRPKRDDVVVMGNEVDGVSKFVLDKADEVVEIARKGSKGSLNVAIAAGVLINRMSQFK